MHSQKINKFVDKTTASIQQETESTQPTSCRKRKEREYADESEGEDDDVSRASSRVSSINSSRSIALENT